MVATGMAQASLSTRAMPVKMVHLLPVHRAIFTGRKKIAVAGRSCKKGLLLKKKMPVTNAIDRACGMQVSRRRVRFTHREWCT